MLEFSLFALLELAKKVAIQAGSTLMEQHEFARQIQQSQERDVKINGDILSEAVIVENLQQYSSFPILSEEAGFIGKSDEEQYLWIVDPLDGSLNYSQGIPFCCISIALWKKNEPILGVIFDFYRNELFSGLIGEGVWLNDVSIKPSNKTTKKEAILCTGFPIRTDFSAEGIKQFVEQVKSFKKVRILGSAALSLAYVACGRVDAYMEDNILIWDIGAGYALVQAAGGKVQIDNLDDVTNPLKVRASCNKEFLG
jgi:myo-inositol-1(or 4)-monophosphatase